MFASFPSSPSSQVYDDLDFDLAGWIQANTPPDAVFMTDPYQNNHIRAESSLVRAWRLCPCVVMCAAHNLVHSRMCY